MHLPELVRSRLAPVYLAVVALVAAATVLTLTPDSKAHAQAGRRLCKYVWQQDVGNPEGRSVSFVVDYKKDGKCPAINPLKVSIPPDVGMWMPSPEVWEKQPVPKITCEEFQRALRLPSNGDGGDPCFDIEDDQLYVVTGARDDDPVPPDPEKKRFWGLQDVSDLGY
jgi:hypothetical protein